MLAFRAVPFCPLGDNPRHPSSSTYLPKGGRSPMSCGFRASVPCRVRPGTKWECEDKIRGGGQNGNAGTISGIPPAPLFLHVPPKARCHAAPGHLFLVMYGGDKSEGTNQRGQIRGDKSEGAKWTQKNHIETVQKQNKNRGRSFPPVPCLMYHRAHHTSHAQ